MCYSAQVWQDYRDLTRIFGAIMSIREFYNLFHRRSNGKKVKLAKAMEVAFKAVGSKEEAEIARMT